MLHTSIIARFVWLRNGNLSALFAENCSNLELVQYQLRLQEHDEGKPHQPYLVA